MIALAASALALLADAAHARPAPDTRAPAPEAVPLVAPPGVVLAPRLLVQTDFVPYRGLDVSPAYGDPVYHRDFRLRRARLGLDAAAEGGWQAKLAVELYGEGDAGQAITGGSTTASDRPRVLDAYVGWGPAAGRGFRLSAGSMKPPFSLSRQIDEGDLALPERPAPVQSMAPEWRVGAAASGDLGLIQYAAGVYDQADRINTGSVDSGYLYVLRLAVEPVGPVGHAPWLRTSADPWWPWWRFSVGASAYYKVRRGDDDWGFEGDAQFQWKRLHVTGEVLYVRRNFQRLGAYVEPGVFVAADRLLLSARWEWLTNHIDYEDPRDGWAGTAGLTYFGFGRRARLQAAFTHRVDARADDFAILRLGFVL